MYVINVPTTHPLHVLLSTYVSVASILLLELVTVHVLYTTKIAQTLNLALWLYTS